MGEAPDLSTDDIVERLRAGADRMDATFDCEFSASLLIREAAGLIEALKERVRVLTELVVAMDDHVSDCCGCFMSADEEMLAAMNECRMALGEATPSHHRESPATEAP